MRQTKDHYNGLERRRMEEIDEAQLVKRAKKDPEAFGKLYQKYVGKIYSYIYARIGNREDAEDLTARTFYRALRNIGSYKERGLPFLAWLYRIAHNVVANWFRDNEVRRRRGEIFLGWEMAEGRLKECPEAKTQANEEREALLAAIKRLPPDYQQLLVLKLSEGMSNAEIGQVIGRNVGAVKSLYFRALIALREDLEKQGF